MCMIDKSQPSVQRSVSGTPVAEMVQFRTVATG